MFIQDLSAHAASTASRPTTWSRRWKSYADRLGLDPQATSGRLHTARAAADLLDGAGLPTATASRSSGISPGRRWAARHSGPDAASAAPQQVVRALRAAPWDNFDLIAG